jgi:hypothetical protein
VFGGNPHKRFVRWTKEFRWKQPHFLLDTMKTVARPRPRDYSLPDDAIRLVPDGMLYDARRGAWIVTQRIERASDVNGSEITVLTDPVSSKLIEIFVFVAPVIGLIALVRMFMSGY